MKSFKEFRLDEGKDRSSNKIDAVETLFDNLRKAFDEFGLGTRKFAWEKMTSSQGKNLVERILRDPKVKISLGEIRKLAKT